MKKENKLTRRKSTRLKNFDYSSAGAYFVTICVRDRMQILSEIVRIDNTATAKTIDTAVGEGLAPPEMFKTDSATIDKTTESSVGEGPTFAKGKLAKFALRTLCSSRDYA